MGKRKKKLFVINKLFPPILRDHLRLAWDLAQRDLAA